MLNKWYVISALIMTSSLCAMEQASSSNVVGLTTVALTPQKEQSQKWLRNTLRRKATRNDATDFKELWSLLEGDDQESLKTEFYTYSQDKINRYEEELKKRDCIRCVKSKPGMIAGGSVAVMSLASTMAGIMLCGPDSSAPLVMSLVVGGLCGSLGGMMSIIYGSRINRDEKYMRDNQSLIQECVCPNNAEEQATMDVVVDFSNDLE